MTVQIILWDRAYIKLAIPGSAVRRAETLPTGLRSPVSKVHKMIIAEDNCCELWERFEMSEGSDKPVTNNISHYYPTVYIRSNCLFFAMS